MLNTVVALFIIPLLFRRFRHHFWQKKRPIYWILMVNSIVSIFTILVSTISFTQGDRFHLVFLSLSLVSLGLVIAENRTPQYLN